jgi:hypothetical protein
MSGSIISQEYNVSISIDGHRSISTSMSVSGIDIDIGG